MNQGDLDFTPRPEDEKIPCEVWETRNGRITAVRANIPPMNAPEAHARKTDPRHSFEAARKAGTKSAQVRAAIEIVFRESGPLTDEELIRKYRERNLSPMASDSGIRTRRKELCDAGKLRAVPDYDGKTKAGNACAVWESVK